MQGAREFLSKVLPWDGAGPDVWFNVHWKAPLSNPTGKNTHYWDGRACAKIEDALWVLNAFQGAGKDFYICMSSQSRFEEKQTKGVGKPYKRAMRFQANVVGLRSFFIDVDVKEKAYATQAAALEALRLFIEALDLPMPTAVVGTGSGGFHVHWVVDRTLTLSEWQPIANALAGACNSLGLITDSQCTIDSVRILRIPGTLNFKSDPPKQVSLISLADEVSYDDFSQALLPYVGFTPVGNPEPSVAFPFPRREAILESSELSAGIVPYEAPLPSIYTIADQCPFIEDALADGGRDYTNPLWFMSLNVASFSAEGRDAAHLLSFQHAGYSEEDTDAQYDRIVRDHQQRDIGWPSCKKIQLSGATQCAACPLLAYDKTPLHFVEQPINTPVPTSGLILTTPHIDHWPDKYARRPDGFIYMSVVADTGKATEQKICPYQISDGWIQHSPWVMHFTAVTSVGRVTKVEIPMSDFGAMGGTRKTLSEHGIVLSDREYKTTQEFLVAWTQKLQHQKDSVVSAVPFGWAESEYGGLEGFTYAGRVWGNGVDRPATVNDPELSRLYTPKGSLQTWIDTTKIITAQGRPGLDMMIAASFAAPLMRFVGHAGMLISGFSTESGVGKSSAFSCGLSVWGDPALTKNGLKDTGNSLFNKLGQIKTLPIYWDEIQNEKDMERFGDFVFDLTGGAEKGRMTRNQKLAKRESWKSLMISACNSSLIDVILKKSKTHNAGLMRIFEFEIPKVESTAVGQISGGVASRAFSSLEQNYGHAGIKYAQFLGANSERVAKEVAEMQDRIDSHYKPQQEERFWIAAIALLLAGANYSNELGLTDIKMKPFRDCLDATLKRMRDSAKGSTADMTKSINVSSTLQGFLAEMSGRHTLRTDRIHVGAGKPLPGSVKVVNDPSRFDGLFVQIGQNDKLVRISARRLTDWLNVKQIPIYSFLEALKTTFNSRVVNGYIGGGTGYRTDAKERLHEIDGAACADLWGEEI